MECLPPSPCKPTSRAGHAGVGSTSHISKVPCHTEPCPSDPIEEPCGPARQVLATTGQRRAHRSQGVGRSPQRGTRFMVLSIVVKTKSNL